MANRFQCLAIVAAITGIAGLSRSVLTQKTKSEPFDQQPKRMGEHTPGDDD